MNSTLTIPAPGRAPRFLLPIIMLLALIGLAAFFALRALAAPGPVVMPLSPAIEERWGIRISQITVTADGGLVDFRFTVIDPDKALAMLQDLENLPVMIAESNGALINSTALMAHKHDLKPGQTSFMLYRNTGGAVKRGGAVTVVFDDLRLDHAPVK